jgi:iron complex outermembrane receptor protein
MKKILFFLFLANNLLAQTDSTSIKPDSLSISDYLSRYGTDPLILQTGNSDDKLVQLNVVGVYATRARSNSPTTFQYISKTELNKNNLGQDLPFLLDNTPSVVTTSDAGAGVGYTGIRIRGSDATRINVTLNGIPVNDAESQNTFWVDLPDIASTAQSVQIQRGVGSSTNGGSAFGGTISVQTQSPSVKPFGEAGVSLGSFRTFRGNIKSGTGLIKNRFFIEASGSWITSDGYIDRASSNLRSWFAQTGYLYNKTLIKFLYFSGRERTYQAWNGVPEDSLKTNRTFNDLGTDYGASFPPYKNQTDNYRQDYFQLLFAQQLPSNFYLNVGLFTTLGRGYYEEFKANKKFSSYFEDGPSTGTDLVRQKWLSNVFYGGTFALSYEKKNISAVLGGLASQFRGKHFGKVVWTAEPIVFDKERNYYEGNSVKTDLNFYAKFNYELLSKVNLYVDVQYRYVAYNTKGIDGDKSTYDANHTWHFVNPKAGILYKIKPEHHTYLSYALGNREPNRDDVLSALASNKTVKPEVMHNIEAGYKFLHRKFPLSINHYTMFYKNQLVLTGKLNDVGNPIKENVAVSLREGVELNGSFRFFKKLTEHNVFSINYSLTYSVNKIQRFDEYIYTYDENYSPVDSLTQIVSHNKSDIAFSPSIIASLELAAYPIKGLEISLVTKAVSKQYLDNTSNEKRKIKPFTYSNLRIAYLLPLKRSDKEIRFTLLFNNIFNRFFESNGYTYSERYGYLDENNQFQTTDTYTYNYYYPQAGFNFLAGVSVRF